MRDVNAMARRVAKVFVQYVRDEAAEGPVGPEDFTELFEMAVQEVLAPRSSRVVLPREVPAPSLRHLAVVR